MRDVSDLRATIVPKSDQLNSEQLLGGPMTITVTDVRLGSSDEQPVVVHYQGDAGRPYKPCKTMRKVLILAWGEDGRAWAGRSMSLFNEPSVKFGGETVGGIRISHLTDIDRDIQVSLTATRGKKAMHVIRRLETPPGSSPTEEIVQETVDHLMAVAEAEGRDAYLAAWKALTPSMKQAIGIPERDRIGRLAKARNESEGA